MPVIHAQGSTLVAAHAYVTIPQAQSFTPVDILVSYTTMGGGEQDAPASPVAPETQPAMFGPFVDGSAIYFVAETPLPIFAGGGETGSKARSVLYKSTDRGSNWTPQYITDSTDDLEACSVWPTGITGELMQVFINGDDDALYSRRWGMASHTSPDTLIDTSTTGVLIQTMAQYVEVEQVSVHPYGTEDLLAAFTRPNVGDTYDEIWLSWYDRSLNTWSASEAVDQEAVQFNTVQVAGASDGTAHIVYADSSDDLWHREYTAGVLSATRQKVNTNGISVITSDLDGFRSAFGSIVGVHHNAGVLHVVWYSETNGKLYHNTVADGSAPGATPVLVSDRVCSHHFTQDATLQGPNACMVGDDDDLYVFFGDATTRDLYVAKYDGTWQTETLHRSMYLMHISAAVLDFGGGDRVIGIIAEDAEADEPTQAEGQMSYDEYSLSGAPAVPVAPATPTGLIAVDNTTGGRVNLTWTPGVGGGIATDYVVEYDQGGGWGIFADNVSAATSANVTGLTDDVSCDFRVSAKNAVGTSSPSSTATATPTTTVGGSPSWVVAPRWTIDNTSSINFTIPGNTVTGDIVVVHVVDSRSAGNPGAAPAGWTQHTTASHIDYSATSYSCVVTSGSANPTDPNDVVTFLRSASADLTVRGVVISNIPGTVDNTDIVTAPIADPNTIAGSITTSGECVIVSFCSVDAGSAGSWTEDQSAEEIWDDTLLSENVLGSACYIKQIAAGTYTPTYTYTSSTVDQELGLEIIAFDV